MEISAVAGSLKKKEKKKERKKKETKKVQRSQREILLGAEGAATNSELERERYS